MMAAYPGDLEADLGEVTVDATGLRMVTINKALAPGLWWLAVVVEEAATVRALYPAGTTLAGTGLAPAGTTHLFTAHQDQYSRPPRPRQRPKRHPS